MRVPMVGAADWALIAAWGALEAPVGGAAMVGVLRWSESWMPLPRCGITALRTLSPVAVVDRVAAAATVATVATVPVPSVGSVKMAATAVQGALAAQGVAVAQAALALEYIQIGILLWTYAVILWQKPLLSEGWRAAAAMVVREGLVERAVMATQGSPRVPAAMVVPVELAEQAAVWLRAVLSMAYTPT